MELSQQTKTKPMHHMKHFLLRQCCKFYKGISSRLPIANCEECAKKIVPATSTLYMYIYKYIVLYCTLYKYIHKYIVSYHCGSQSSVVGVGTVGGAEVGQLPGGVPGPVWL